MRDHRRAVLAVDVEDETVIGDGKMQGVRPGIVAVRQKKILLEQIVDRDRALVLDVGAGPPDRIFVERDRYESATCGGAFICG